MGTCFSTPTQPRRTTRFTQAERERRLSGDTLRPRGMLPPEEASHPRENLPPLESYLRYILNPYASMEQGLRKNHPKEIGMPEERPMG
jgi:hypothetical protein